MFTGLVEQRGRVEAAGARLEVASAFASADVGLGDSIAVNGVCLTVVDRRPIGDGLLLGFDVSDETLRRTSLGGLDAGVPVNLERPVTLMQRLGGHLVQGHVDGVGRVSAVREAAIGTEMTFEIPTDLMRYVVEKGSIALDGVSLTVAEIGEGTIAVALIPFTLEATNLGEKHRGDPVNVEVDVMAKYAERLLQETT